MQENRVNKQYYFQYFWNFMILGFFFKISFNHDNTNINTDACWSTADDYITGELTLLLKITLIGWILG